MKKILLIVACALTSLLSQAQEDSVRFMYSIGFGTQYTQFQGSAQMKDNFGTNYNIDANAFTMNFTCSSIYKRFVFSGEFGGLQRKVTDDSYMSSTIAQGFGYFNFGYVVLDKPRFMMYPFVGIGSTFTTLVLKNKSATDWSDPDYLVRSGQKGNFSSIGASINAGLSFRKTCKHTRYGKQLQLGLDLGVHITPGKTDWTYDGSDEKVDSFGTANNVGYYARFTIGGLMSRALDRDGSVK